jgi:hypothetical protein
MNSTTNFYIFWKKNASS